jgi:hypothetical protein
LKQGQVRKYSPIKAKESCEEDAPCKKGKKVEIHKAVIPAWFIL